MAEQTMTKKKGLKKGWRIVLGILAGLILLYAVLGVLPRRENYALANPMMKEGALPLLIAHGGGNKEFPDNTLEAFYNAYSVDKNAMMETDVSITRDGVVILSHDTTLDRKTNVTGRIIDWNYSDLMAAFPQNRINVEIKQSGETGMKAMKEVLRLLEQYDAWDRVVLASFHDEIYEEYQRLQKAGEVPESFMCSPGVGGVAKFYLLQAVNADVFFGDQMCVFQTEAFVKRMHSHNLAVHYWTINDPEEMRYLIGIGADGIMTDYPHLLKEVYDSYGK